METELDGALSDYEDLWLGRNRFCLNLLCELLSIANGQFIRTFLWSQQISAHCIGSRILLLEVRITSIASKIPRCIKN